MLLDDVQLCLFCVKGQVLESICKGPPVLQVLEREERSLGALLEEFCGVHKQKQHQLADWRQRYRPPQKYPKAPSGIP